jgi:hypothetical protein
MIKALIVVYLVGVVVFTHQFYRLSKDGMNYPMGARIVTALFWPWLLFLVARDWVVSLWKARRYRGGDDDQA